jgi:hypothetical protein
MVGALRDAVALARHRAVRLRDAGRIENRLVDLDGAVIEASGNRLERRFQQYPRFIVLWQVDPIKKVVSVPAVGNDRFGPGNTHRCIQFHRILRSRLSQPHTC